MFNFNFEKVNWEKELGEGQFGKVYPYKNNQIDDPCVVKHLITNSVDEMLDFVQEIVLGFGCDHPNVLSVRGYHIRFEKTTRSWNVFIKLSQMEGSLKDQLTKNKYFSEQQIVEYFYDLSNGLSYLHGKGIAHRDIKPDNILINKKNRIHIADFGLCKLIGDETSYTLKDVAGTIRYTAPEILAKKDGKNIHLKKRALFIADLWSLGLVMAELCLSESGKQSEHELPGKIKKLQGKGYSKVLIELISSLLQIEPSKRKSLHEIQKTLEEHYPFLLKKQNKEVQTSFDTEIREPIKKSQTISNLDNQISELSSQPKRPEARLSKMKEESGSPKKQVGGFTSPQKKLVETKEERITKNRSSNTTIKKEEKDKRIDLKARMTGNHSKFDDPRRKVQAPAQEQIEEAKIQEPTLSKQKIDEILKDFQEKWRKDFKIEMEFQKSAKIGAANDNIDDNLLESLMDEFNQVQNLTKNTGIKQFEINFGNCYKITDNGVKELAEKIGSNIKSVQQLALNFGAADGWYNQNITDSSLEELARQIGYNLKNIQELTLNFRSCVQISNEGIIDLSTQIGANLKTIQKLNLNFSWCEKITDDGLSKLAQEIGSNFKQLLEFKLNFARCKQISDKGIRELSAQMGSNLKNIQHLELYFNGCDKITDDGFNKLAQEIESNLKKLQQLTLYFYGGTRVSEQAKEKFRSSCKFIPKVEI